MLPNSKYWLLGGGFGLVIALMSALELASLQKADALAELTHKLYQHPLTVSNAVLEANADVIAMHRHMKDVVLARNAEDLKLAISKVDENEKLVYQHFEVVMDRFLGDTSKIVEARNVFTAWKVIRSEVIELTRAGKYDEAAAITMGKGARHVTLLTSHMNGLIDFARDKAAEFLKDSDRQHEDYNTFIYFLFIGTMLAAGSIAYFAVIQTKKYDEKLMGEIDERKKAQKDTKEAIELNERIITESPIGLLIYDQAGQCLAANEAAGVLIGSTKEQVLSQNYNDLESWKKSGLLEKAEEALSTLDNQRLDLHITSSFGKDVYLDCHFVPISLGSELRLLLMIDDISERTHSEEQLRQSQKMDAVGQLTGGIAHDFNNLLAIALGNLELAEERLDENSDEYNLAEKSIAAIRRGAGLTQRLLAFSRKQALEPRLTDIGQLVSGMLDLINRTLGETINIQVIKASNLWKCVIDPLQLETALLNVAINARDAMPEGGKLIIETGNRYLDDDYAASHADVDPGEYVMISIIDDGIGIVPEYMHRIFEPFFTTKELGKGTGLGLSQVYGFAKQSGGHIDVISEEGEGTSVTIFLPHIQSDDVKKAEKNVGSGESQGAGDETVLVVEDDQDVREMTVKMLDGLGYKTLEADTAKSALIMLKNNPYIDVLLTDVILPEGVNGLELAREARQKRPDTKILFMSGFTEDPTIHKWRSKENVLFIQKPFQKRDLAYMVKSTLVGTSEEQ